MYHFVTFFTQTDDFEPHSRDLMKTERGLYHLHKAEHVKNMNNGTKTKKQQLGRSEQILCHISSSWLQLPYIIQAGLQLHKKLVTKGYRSTSLYNVQYKKKLFPGKSQKRKFGLFHLFPKYSLTCRAHCAHTQSTWWSAAELFISPYSVRVTLQQ